MYLLQFHTTQIQMLSENKYICDFLRAFAKLWSLSSPAIVHSIQHVKDRQPFIDAPQHCATYHRAEYHKASKFSAVIHVYLLYPECVCSLSHAPCYIATCDLPDCHNFPRFFIKGMTFGEKFVEYKMCFGCLYKFHLKLFFYFIIIILTASVV